MKHAPFNYLHYCATQNAKNRGFNVISRFECDNDSTPLRVLIEFPDLNWKCSANADGITIDYDGETRVYEWNDFSPEQVAIGIDFVGFAKSTPLAIVTVPVQRTGSWSRFTAPATFVMWAWNAGLRTAKTP